MELTPQQVMLLRLLSQQAPPRAALAFLKARSGLADDVLRDTASALAAAGLAEAADGWLLLTEAGLLELYLYNTLEPARVRVHICSSGR